MSKTKPKSLRDVIKVHPAADLFPMMTAGELKALGEDISKNGLHTRYVVLDDDDDCLDELPLFQPSPKTGLTAEIARGIEHFLAGRSDKDMRANTITRLGQNIHALFGRDKS